jgi:hypothetical protein
LGRYRWGRQGRKKKARVDLAKAFVAKAVYNLATTKVLIAYLTDCKSLRRLCGWEKRSEVPSESTFSRAFDELARGDLGEVVHAAMVRSHYGDKLAGHVSRDATAIKAREKAAKKARPAAQPKRKRGRPRKGEVREPAPPTRLEAQPTRSLSENLADLPTACDW